MPLIPSLLESFRLKSFVITIRPLSAFGTPMAGDTLFGQLCWAIAMRRGETEFKELLHGYTQGSPFGVVSDAFPKGFLPRATLPDFVYGGLELDPLARKTLKRRQWLPTEGRELPYREWITQAKAVWPSRTVTVTQNTIHRLSGTTGSGVFSPRQVEQIAFLNDTMFEIYGVIDTDRLSLEELMEAFCDIGQSGFGRDASTGLGKFDVVSSQTIDASKSDSLDFMTLAPCAPKVSDLDASGCWTQPLTRFGRHGSVLATGGKPFKSPIMFAATGAVLRIRSGTKLFHGVGIGGPDAPISTSMPKTVHQGYAPLLPIHLDVRL
jgi:CRISPR-associated protein Csm4